MFAIIETSGTQYKVEKGQTLEIDRVDSKEGLTLNFDRVLLIHDKDTKVGTPLIAGASVSAKIVTHKKGDKITVFKMKPKKRYKKTLGHRQYLTTIEITDIKAAGVKKAKSAGQPAEKTKTAKKTPKK